MPRICVFCGSSDRVAAHYLEAATAMGAAIAARGYGLVYGGGRVGLMGAVAEAASSAGVEVIGVIPDALVKRERAEYAVGDLRVVETMHERKALMADLSIAFIALPGGMGTFEELFEVLTWSQLGLQDKPCALLDVAGYFDPLADLLDHAVVEGFIRKEDRDLVIIETDPETILDRLESYEPPPRDHWVDAEDR